MSGPWMLNGVVQLAQANTDFGSKNLITTGTILTSNTITGSGFIASGSSVFTIPETVTTPTFIQTARSTDNLPAAMIFQPQFANAAATGANQIAGPFVINLGIPTNGGITETYLKVQRNSVNKVQIGCLSGNPAFAGVWIQATPSGTNYTLLSEGSNTYLNAPTGGLLAMSVNGANKFTTTATGHGFYGAAAAAKPVVSGVKVDAVAGSIVVALASIGLVTNSTT
jgi:hypothetical protein